MDTGVILQALTEAVVESFGPDAWVKIERGAFRTAICCMVVRRNADFFGYSGSNLGSVARTTARATLLRKDLRDGPALRRLRVVVAAIDRRERAAQHRRDADAAWGAGHYMRHLQLRSDAEQLEAEAEQLEQHALVGLTP